MKYVIDESVCMREGFTLPEVLVLMLIKCDVSTSLIINHLMSKGVLVKNMFGEYQITQNWNDKLDSALLDSEAENIEENDLYVESLAKDLMNIFPKGKKEGTNVYWKGNLKDTKLRLKKFFKLYSNKYTKEQIVGAAKRYVESFNGNYSFMRVLKYFIWKDIKRVDSSGKGYIEETSELATLIENEDQENSNKDWITKLI